MTNVVIAPDSFKGSVSAADVASAVAAGWRAVRPDDEIVELPQADGGEGTLDAVARAVPGSRMRDAGTVTGPDGRPTTGRWLELPGGGALVELADASGLPLMHELDALGASTRGMGEVIRAALDAGASSLAIALGGSASTDGGAGALAALGLRLLDADGVELPDGGGALARLASVDRSALMAAPGSVLMLTDVTAPLLGPAGAAAVFGPQKGADASQVRELDTALARFAEVLGGDVDAAGAGAAGGTGFGFASAFGATLTSGADYIAEVTGLDAAIARADVVLTGEGRFDSQSLTGKVVGAILDRATAKRTGVIAGQLSEAPPDWGTSLVAESGSVEAAMGEPLTWLRAAGARAARDLG